MWHALFSVYSIYEIASGIANWFIKINLDFCPLNLFVVLTDHYLTKHTPSHSNRWLCAITEATVIQLLRKPLILNVS